MFEDVSDPDRNSVTNRSWWQWDPVDADEAKRDILKACGYLSLFLGLSLWNRWPRLDRFQIALYVLALLLLVAVAFTRSQAVVVAFAAETAVLAWVVGMPGAAGQDLRISFFYFSLPFISLFWLGGRCSSYHRFRARAADAVPGQERIDPA